MMGVTKLIIVCASLCLASCSNIGSTRQDISLDNDGGYGDILVAIDETLAPDMSLLDGILTYFTNASEVLLTATNEQVYFKSVTIRIPDHWTTDPTWLPPTPDEVFNRARVVVGGSNPAYGEVPYTLQPGGCGLEGDYIHFTPTYIKEVGPVTKPEKRLVREFAHLKWGLFDENVPETDIVSPHFYSLNSQPIPTRCVEEGIYGRIVDTNSESGICQYDTELNNIPSTCRFIPDNDETRALASLLYDEQLDSIVKFCSYSDDGETAPEIRHNALAPNRQNRLCDGRSAWQVMDTLDDFVVDHKSNRNNAVPPPPTFRIVQREAAEPGGTTTTPSGGDEPFCKADIVCLVLDVSGSMNDFNRIGQMATAIKNYILNYLRDGSIVGIVSFSSSYTTLAGMTEITSDAVRSSLVAAVPTVADGGTSIGSGLTGCKDLLVAYTGADVGNTRIMLLTDGEQNVDPAADVVLPEIISLGITVDTIAYSQAADPVLADIADQTGGLKHFTSDESTQKLTSFLLETVERCDEIIIILINDKITIPDNAADSTGSFYCDSTIGMNTTLIIFYEVDVTIEITTEQNNPVTIVKDSALGIISVIIDGQVNGLVGYTLTKVNPADTGNVTLTVTSYPIPGIQPMLVTSRVSEDTIDFGPDTMLNAYVEIFQGLTPLVDLTVTGTVETPSGADIIVVYRDDGMGFDTTANDGIYWTFIPAHSFTGDGYYSLEVDVTGEAFLPAVGSGRSKRSTHNTSSSLGQVTRNTAGGLVIVNNFSPVNDQTPPEQIRDLTLIGSGNSTSAVYTLGWTAPGDDINVGQAAGYKVYASDQYLILNDFVEVPASAILTDLNSLLVPAGSQLQLKVDTDNIAPSLFGLSNSANVSTYYFRISAVDAAGNEAALSNPVSASVIDPTFGFPVATEVEDDLTQLYIILGVTLGAFGLISLVVALIFVALTAYKAKKRIPSSRRDDRLRQVTTVYDYDTPRDAMYAYYGKANRFPADFSGVYNSAYNSRGDDKRVHSSNGYVYVQ